MAHLVNDVQIKPRNKSYAGIITLLKNNPGEWISIDNDEVTGPTCARKQQAIIQAARNAGMKVQTRGRDGGIYVRLLAEVPDAHGSSSE